mgnify:CR=1 FL=1
MNMKPPTNNTPPQGYKMTELGALPEEWEIINLDKIIDLKRGISWRKDEANKEGIGIPVIGIPNIKENGNIDFTDTYFLTKNIPNDKMVRINDILFVGSSGSIKNIGRNVLIKEIQQNKFTYASFTFLGRVNPLNANTVYIFYLLNSSFVDYDKYTRRASDGKYNFQLTQFKNEQKIPLPPLPEQQKIAAVLSAVQEAKEKTEAVIATAKALKKSMMKHLYTYGPVSPQEAETVSLKETEIGPVPEDWEVARLGEYCNVFSGYAFKSDDFCNNGILVVKIGNLQNGSIVFNAKESFFPREKINDDMSKFILNEGDILIALTGATTGKISLVPKSVNGALLNQRVGKFSFYNDSLYKSFVMYYFITDEFQNHIKINIMQSAQGNISPKQIETFPIPLPPLPEQQKIASILSAIDEKIEAEENKKKALEELFKTLLHNLMTAKIRVNQLEVTS